ncbi:unnamed protein product [Polarella glacialis]|uniref:Uncharacterized protein n=1 Tax=Polarella glacialis TaxID=89957 RepID=A0A813KTZ6_POLGL|nr:unnamed protein product [Polarella glacialis]
MEWSGVECGVEWSRVWSGVWSGVWNGVEWSGMERNEALKGDCGRAWTASPHSNATSSASVTADGTARSSGPGPGSVSVITQPLERKGRGGGPMQPRHNTSLPCWFKENIWSTGRQGQQQQQQQQHQ